MLTIENFAEGFIEKGQIEEGFLDNYPDYIPPAYVSRAKSMDNNPLVRDDIINIGESIKKASESGRFEIIVNFGLFNTDESIEVLYRTAFMMNSPAKAITSTRTQIAVSFVFGGARMTLIRR